MPNAGKVIDSIINKETVSNEEKRDARNLPWLDKPVIADSLVVKDRFRPGVSETPPDILLDWLETLSLIDADFFGDGEILRRRLDITVWDAER